jgi:transcriptional regulator with XRE-family HTH domain
LAEVETGKRNISIVNLERICDGLQVSLADFFADELFEQ